MSATSAKGGKTVAQLRGRYERRERQVKARCVMTLRLFGPQTVVDPPAVAVSTGAQEPARLVGMARAQELRHLPPGGQVHDRAVGERVIVAPEIGEGAVDAA